MAKNESLPHPLLLSLHAAAENLSISRRSIERMIHLGSLKSVTIGGRRLVQFSELQRLARHGQAANAAAELRDVSAAGASDPIGQPRADDDLAGMERE